MKMFAPDQPDSTANFGGQLSFPAAAWYNKSDFSGWQAAAAGFAEGEIQP
ncbi:hypothetical protein [uncultured Gemmiger sp.]|nr:hypothetical protein [uncultured Gemmiger sp.]